MMSLNKNNYNNSQILIETAHNKQCKKIKVLKKDNK